MRAAAMVVLGLLAPFSACDDVEGQLFDAGDGRMLTLLSIEADTKETASGRTVGYLVATFAEPEGMQGAERRPLAEKLCPRILAEAGAPDEVDGARLETVLIKYRDGGREILGFSLGRSTNYWIELNRGECVART